MAAETQVVTIIRSSQSVDLPALSSGVITADVTIVGAEVGDSVVVTKPTNATITDDVVLSGYCETADTVTVVAASNDATATTNFGAATLDFLVFK